MKYPEIKALAAKLRKNQTYAELQLWEHLRMRKLLNQRFLRQHPIFYDSKKRDHNFFIADFYCAEQKLVIEVDGKIHDYQKDRDLKRDRILNSKGLRVLRIRNEEMQNTKEVIRKIINMLSLQAD